MAERHARGEVADAKGSNPFGCIMIKPDRIFRIGDLVATYREPLYERASPAPVFIGIVLSENRIYWGPKIEDSPSWNGEDEKNFKLISYGRPISEYMGIKLLSAAK